MRLLTPTGNLYATRFREPPGGGGRLSQGIHWAQISKSIEHPKQIVLKGRPCGSSRLRLSNFGTPTVTNWTCLRHWSTLTREGTLLRKSQTLTRRLLNAPPPIIERLLLVVEPHRLADPWRKQPIAFPFGGGKGAFERLVPAMPCQAEASSMTG